MTQIGLTPIILNKYNKLDIIFTSLTRVTPHFEQIRAPLPGSINPYSDLELHLPRSDGGTLRFSLRHGVGNPRNLVSGKPPSLVNR